MDGPSHQAPITKAETRSSSSHTSKPTSSAPKNELEGSKTKKKNGKRNPSKTLQSPNKLDSKNKDEDRNNEASKSRKPTSTHQHPKKNKKETYSTQLCNQSPPTAESLNADSSPPFRDADIDKQPTNDDMTRSNRERHLREHGVWNYNKNSRYGHDTNNPGHISQGTPQAYLRWSHNSPPVQISGPSYLRYSDSLPDYTYRPQSPQYHLDSQQQQMDIQQGQVNIQHQTMSSRGHMPTQIQPYTTGFNRQAGPHRQSFSSDRPFYMKPNLMGCPNSSYTGVPGQQQGYGATRPRSQHSQPGAMKQELVPQQPNSQARDTNKHFRSVTDKAKMMKALECGHVFDPSSIAAHGYENHDLMVRCHGFTFYCHAHMLCEFSTFFANNYPPIYQYGKKSNPASKVKIMQVDCFDRTQLSAALRFIYQLDYDNKDVNVASPMQSTCLPTNVVMYLTGVTLGIPRLMEFADKWLRLSACKLRHCLGGYGGKENMWRRRALNNQLVRCWQLIFDQPRTFYTHPNMSQVRFNIAWITNKIVPALLRADPPENELEQGDWTMATDLKTGTWEDLGEQFCCEMAYWAGFNKTDPALSLGKFSDPAVLEKFRDYFPKPPTSSSRKFTSVPGMSTDEHTFKDITVISQPHGSVTNGFGSRSYDARPFIPVRTDDGQPLPPPCTTTGTSFDDHASHEKQAEDEAGYMVRRYLEGCDDTGISDLKGDSRAEEHQPDGNTSSGDLKDVDHENPANPLSESSMVDDAEIDRVSKRTDKSETHAKEVQAVICIEKSTQVTSLPPPTSYRDTCTQTDLRFSKIKSRGTTSQPDVALPKMKSGAAASQPNFPLPKMKSPETASQADLALSKMKSQRTASQPDVALPKMKSGATASQPDLALSKTKSRSTASQLDFPLLKTKSPETTSQPDLASSKMKPRRTVNQQDLPLPKMKSPKAATPTELPQAKLEQQAPIEEVWSVVRKGGKKTKKNRSGKQKPVIHSNNADSTLKGSHQAPAHSAEAPPQPSPPITTSDQKVDRTWAEIASKKK